MLCAGHVKTELLDIGLLRIELSDDLSVMHDQNTVGQTHDLVQLQGDEEDCLAAVPLLNDLGMNEFDGAHIESAGRLHRHDQCLITIDLTGDDRLLLVAA